MSKISPAIFSRLTPIGPIPSIHPFVFPPKSALGTSQSLKILAIPNNPSAFDLNNPSISPPGNILATPPITPANSVLIPLIISLNSAPINWSPIHSVKFSTLFVKSVSKLATSRTNLSVTFFTTQGIASWIFKTGFIIAFCALAAAFFASDILPVAARTLPYSSLYNLCKPPLSSGDKESNVVFTISFIIPLEALTICSAPSNIPLNLSLKVIDFISLNVFFSVFFIWFVAFALLSEPPAPCAYISSCPIALKAWVSGYWNFFLSPSIIFLELSAALFKSFLIPVWVAPPSITCFNSSDTSVAACLSWSESTSCSSCAFPASVASFRSSIKSLGKNLGDFWLLDESSPPSFFAMNSLLGLILLVYPVNGLKGPAYSSLGE